MRGSWTGWLAWLVLAAVVVVSSCQALTADAASLAAVIPR